MIEIVGPDHPEIELILAKLPELTTVLMDGLNAKGMLTMPHSYLLDNIKDHVGGAERDYTLVTAGPCVVGYNLVQSWWSRQVNLLEEFIIRYKPGNFSDTIKDLEQHAKDLWCDNLVISSLAMLRQESYGEYLKRKGFREVARQYVKGIE